MSFGFKRTEPSPIVMSLIPLSFRRTTMSSTTRDVVTTPHLGKGTSLVQKTTLGFMKSFAWEGRESRPFDRATAFATDSKGLSYLTMETMCLCIVRIVPFQLRVRLY